jgi:hypothetical protein
VSPERRLTLWLALIRTWEEEPEGLATANAACGAVAMVCEEPEAATRIVAAGGVTVMAEALLSGQSSLQHRCAMICAVLCCGGGVCYAWGMAEAPMSGQCLSAPPVCDAWCVRGFVVHGVGWAIILEASGRQKQLKARSPALAPDELFPCSHPPPSLPSPLPTRTD